MICPNFYGWTKRGCAMEIPQGKFLVWTNKGADLVYYEDGALIGTNAPVSLGDVEYYKMETNPFGEVLT